MKSGSNRTPAKPNPTHHNAESGSEVAQSNTTAPLSEAGAGTGKVRRKLSRTHADYWRSRLFRRGYENKGHTHEINDLYVRIQHAGRREFFALTTTDQSVAAAKARDIYIFIKSNGWEAALAKFKPATAPKTDVTVGDFLAAVENTGKIAPKTFYNYRKCLRTIVAEVFGVRPQAGENKYDYRAGGHDAWLKRVDEIRLERLTPERVNQWKRDRIASVRNSPKALASAQRTINSYLRCSRAMFSRKPNRKTQEPGVLVEVEKTLKLPAVLPFDGVGFCERGRTKYVSKINPQLLIAAARRELKVSDPEAYKVFLLGLFAGMRKAEIDLAEWSMLNFVKSSIVLVNTDWLHLKTAESEAEITVDPEVMAELRAMMPPPTGKRVQWSQFVLVSERPPRPESPRPYYRCEDTFDRLNVWLRSNGITANKPLHELRKELGAIIASTHGIYAASKFLRHSDITTTDRHYADQKSRISVGLGKLLEPSVKPLDGKAAKLFKQICALAPCERAALIAALATQSDHSPQVPVAA